MAELVKEENKNIYYQCRKEQNLSREKASELLERIPPERIERIENEKFEPYPDEVVLMSEKYKRPDLCNYYCANQCAIGKKYVPEVKVKDFSQIVLQMVASLNTLGGKKDRLIEIAADGMITGEELTDFIHIQKELEKVSITVEALQLWAEKMIASGAIDKEEYEKHITE